MALTKALEPSYEIADADQSARRLWPDERRDRRGRLSPAPQPSYRAHRADSRQQEDQRRRFWNCGGVTDDVVRRSEAGYEARIVWPGCVSDKNQRMRHTLSKNYPKSASPNPRRQNRTGLSPRVQ